MAGILVSLKQCGLWDENTVRWGRRQGDLRSFVHDTICNPDGASLAPAAGSMGEKDGPRRRGMGLERSLGSAGSGGESSAPCVKKKDGAHGSSTSSVRVASSAAGPWSIESRSVPRAVFARFIFGVAFILAKRSRKTLSRCSHVISLTSIVEKSFANWAASSYDPVTVLCLWSSW